MEDNVTAISAAKRQLLRLLLEPTRTDRLSLADDPTPLSLAQRRLWFVELLQPGLAAYNTECIYELSGELNSSALRSSVERLLRRQECLRAHIDASGEEPLLAIDADCSIELAVVDLCDLEPDTQQGTIRAACGVRFDLREGPLFRATLFRLGERLHVMLLSMHHIISDGWSLAVMANELSESYNAALAGRPPRLPTLRAQYRDFVRAERRNSQRGLLKESLEFWRTRLKGARAVDLPNPLKAQRTPSMRRGRGLDTVLESEVAAMVRDLARRVGGSPFMVYFAAFCALLAHRSGQTDMTIGAPVGTRAGREYECLVGLFLNTLALRITWSGDPTFTELLRTVRDEALDAYEHQAVPFNEVAEILGSQPHASGNFPINCMFVMQNAPAARLTFSGIDVRLHEVPSTTALFDVLLQIEEGDFPVVSLQYDLACLDRKSAARLLDEYAVILGAALHRPDQALSVLCAKASEPRSLRGPQLEEHVRYWQQQLAAVPATHRLPVRSTHATAPRPFTVATHTQALEPGLLRALRSLQRLGDNTSLEVIHAAFAVVLARLSGSHDIVIGIPVSPAQSGNATASAILPVRTRLDGALTFAPLLGAVTATIRDARRHQDLPFELLVHRLNPFRHEPHAPLVQILVREGAAARPVPAARSHYDLAVGVNDELRAVTLHFEYAQALFDTRFITRLAAQLTAVIHAVAAVPETRMCDLPLPPWQSPPENTAPKPAIPAQTAAFSLGRFVQRVWQEELHCCVGMDDDFFAMGGDRTIALRIVTRLSNELQLVLPLQRLLANPTVRETATALESLIGGLEALTETLKIIELVESLPEEDVASLLDGYTG